jgi:hypothetical protein
MLLSHTLLGQCLMSNTYTCNFHFSSLHRYPSTLYYTRLFLSLCASLADSSRFLSHGIVMPNETALGQQTMYGKCFSYAYLTFFIIVKFQLLVGRAMLHRIMSTNDSFESFISTSLINILYLRCVNIVTLVICVGLVLFIVKRTWKINCLSVLCA